MSNQDSRVQEVIQRESQDFGVSRQLPIYQSHKKVWALKIAEVLSPAGENEESDGTLIIVPADEGYAPFRVDREYVRKHSPVAGGYYVVYSDGYKSWSPAQAFEEGYMRVSA